MQLNLGNVGLGMYPDEVCFDPSRPSWLPYWLDTPGEESCKFQNVLFGSVPGATVVPGTSDTGGTKIYTGTDPTAVNNMKAACTANNGTWDDVNNKCTPSFFGQYGTYIIIGGVAIAALAVLGMVTGRK